jgi:cytoskeletal protein CcmA (bactofilin family)
MNESRLRRFRDRSTGVPTLINVGCKISGMITGKCDIQINGEVDGDCDVEGTLSLVREGYWRGTIKADNVVVSGHVEGDIIARGKVEISDTARITGTVTGAAIAVAEGAVVEGQMKTTEQPDPVGFVEKRRQRDDD